MDFSLKPIRMSVKPHGDAIKAGAKDETIHVLVTFDFDDIDPEIFADTVGMRGMRLSLGAFWRDRNPNLDFLHKLEKTTPTKIGNDILMVPSVKIPVSELIEFETRPTSRGAADPVKVFVRNIGKMTSDQIMEVKDSLSDAQRQQLLESLS